MQIPRKKVWFLLSWILFGFSFAQGTTPSLSPDGTTLLDAKHLGHIDLVVQKAIDRGDIPGAVVLISVKNQTIFKKAYGLSQIVPEPQPMKSGMMFDMASVTKPVATATSIMILAERGLLRLTDRVSQYVPGFSRFCRPDSSAAEEARIWHLLTHTSGLPPYTDAKKAGDLLGVPCTTAALINHIAKLPKLNAPGEAYHYSCLGFITLNHIIEKVSGQNVNGFSRDNIFVPLGMKHSTFIPDSSLISLCVPTEMTDGASLRGVVHDPLARLQGGISGNAGLFSTVDDLVRYGRMMLNGGSLDGVKILSPVTVNRMIRIADTPCKAARGYGWVVKQGPSWVGGDLLPDGGYGHTGYTGTSLWIDPATQTIIIILSNRVHPKDDGEVDSLRSAIANIVAGAIIGF